VTVKLQTNLLHRMASFWRRKTIVIRGFPFIACGSNLGEVAMDFGLPDRVMNNTGSGLEPDHLPRPMSASSHVVL